MAFLLEAELLDKLAWREDADVVASGLEEVAVSGDERVEVLALCECEQVVVVGVGGALRDGGRILDELQPVGESGEVGGAAILGGVLGELRPGEHFLQLLHEQWAGEGFYAAVKQRVEDERGR